LVNTDITLANSSSHVTRFIKICDIEQRLNIENINLATQSSKESFSLLYCCYFNQICGFWYSFDAAQLQSKG